MKEVHVNDYGWTIYITVMGKDNNPLDLTLSNSVEISFSKPNSQISFLKTASFVTDGSDGQVYYTIQSGDIDEIGTWQIQVITTSSNSTLRSNIEKLKVLRNI